MPGRGKKIKAIEETAFEVFWGVVVTVDRPVGGQSKGWDLGGHLKVRKETKKRERGRAQRKKKRESLWREEKKLSREIDSVGPGEGRWENVTLCGQHERRKGKRLGALERTSGISLNGKKKTQNQKKKQAPEWGAVCRCTLFNNRPEFLVTRGTETRMKGVLPGNLKKSDPKIVANYRWQPPVFSRFSKKTLGKIKKKWEKPGSRYLSGGGEGEEKGSK